MKKDRRDFLKAAAMATTTYCMVIKAPQSLSAAGDEDITRQSIAPKIDTLSPDDIKRGLAPDEPNMLRVELKCDVFVAGGGLAGLCAAIAAARNGSKVILAQDRSRLGGNASSEIHMHPMGSKFGIRETGLIEEFSLANAFTNEQYAWEIWDLMLYDMCIREPNIKLLLDSSLYRAEVKDNLITDVWVRCDKTEHLYHIQSPIYLDCTGDSRLALEAGAEYMIGREPVETFDEPLAGYDKPGTTQGSSILFTSRKHDKPMGFEPPSWARVLGPSDLEHRHISSTHWEYGYWWIELGGVYDTIRDNERLRFELLAIVLGMWDYIKNSGNYPEAENWALETVGMIPGKRESRRVTGEYIMTQHDIEGAWKKYTDAVAFGGWPMDDHPARGFDAKEIKPFRPAKYDSAYNIPFGSLYSKNIGNLLVAGRNISASHVAFSSTRVMKTCAVIGQAAGTAAMICARDHILPSQLRNDPARMKNFQQQLLRDDQTIQQCRNEDENDLARKSKVTASDSSRNTKPEYILTGVTREARGKTKERWIAPMADKPVWIKLDWDTPATISQIQLTHDTGLYRTLTMTAAYSLQKKMESGPQEETNRDYTITGILPDGTEKELAKVTGNYQRLRRHNFDPVKLKAIRVDITRTQGKEARLYEIRAYA